MDPGFLVGLVWNRNIYGNKCIKKEKKSQTSKRRKVTCDAEFFTYICAVALFCTRINKTVKKNINKFITKPMNTNIYKE